MPKVARIAAAAAALCLACAPRGAATSVDADEAIVRLQAPQEPPARRTILREAAERAQLCRTHATLPPEACWAPSDDDYQAAIEEHLKLAAARREGTKRLDDATDRACAGLSDFDRDVSPFAHRGDITRVEAIDADGHVAGARVFLRLVPGLSGDKLQRIVDCHIAQAEELDHRVPEESFCPLNPPGVRAAVRQAPDGYVVDVTSADADGAAEVLRRAVELTHGGAPVGRGPRD